MASPTDGEAVATLLAPLVAFDTQNPTGDEAPMAAHLAERLKAHAPDALDVVEVGRHRAVLARWGTPRTMLNVHLDTVPAGETGWTGDPHVLRRDGDRVIGLGAADTKGAIAATLVALDDVKPRDVLVAFTGDEERTSTVIQHLIAGGRLAGVERAVVCEPTSLAVGVRHRGIVSFTATIEGVGGHSSRADETRAPISDAARLAVAFDAWGKVRRPTGPPGFLGMCLNVARIDGGIAFNVIPRTARLEVSLRPPPGAELPAIMADLSALAARILPDARLAWGRTNAPFATRDLASFRPLLGDHLARPIDLAFWTEAAMLSAAGIDAVVFGAGAIDVAHAPDEHVSLGDLGGLRVALRTVLDGAR